MTLLLMQRQYGADVLSWSVEASAGLGFVMHASFVGVSVPDG